MNKRRTKIDKVKVQAYLPKELFALMDEEMDERRWGPSTLLQEIVEDHYMRNGKLEPRVKPEE